MAYFKGIVIFVLLVNIISEFIPADSYKKYLKHISGIILVLMIIEPITKYFNLNNFENKVNKFFMQNNIMEVNEFMADTDTKALDKTILIYKEEIEGEIKTYLKNSNFDVSDVEAVISVTKENEMQIDYIEIDLKFINYQTENEYIKEIIEEKFLISKEIIEVV